MKNLFATAAAAAALVTVAGAAAPAAAETNASLGYSSVDTDTVRFDAVTGRVGWKAGYFGVEGEVSAGLNKENDAGVEYKLQHQAAIYGTATMPMTENFDLFARVGYGTTKVKASAGGVGLTGSEESWNYGAGADYYFDGRNGLRGEYTRHDFRHGAGEADVWSVSYVHKF